MPIAAFTLTLETKPGKMLYASRGIVNPTTRAPPAYNNGMSQELTGGLRELKAICLLFSTTFAFHSGAWDPSWSSARFDETFKASLLDVVLSELAAPTRAGWRIGPSENLLDWNAKSLVGATRGFKNQQESAGSSPSQEQSLSMKQRKPLSFD